MKSFQFLEGRRYAIAMLESVEHTPPSFCDDRSPVVMAIENLREAAKRYPVDYAKGVMSVVEAFENE